VSRKAPEHHAVFSRLRPWRGFVPDRYLADFLGVLTRESYYKFWRPSHPTNQVTDVPLPDFDEEYFEWISLLEAVTMAKDEFVMLELGAGFGRWLVRGAFAIRQYSNLPFRLVGVEAEPTHFRWMRQHFRDNGLNPDEHQLIRAAAADRDGRLWFRVGSADEWYGQGIAAPSDPTPRSFVQRLLSLPVSLDGHRVRFQSVKAVCLNTLLAPLARVDLIDLDVQGAEYEILRPAAAEMNAKVRRVHIETHSRDVESQLRELFQDIKWKNKHDYPCESVCETPWREMKFQGGVQSWVNPRLW
jgi:FkbM family methyltransferase